MASSLSSQRRRAIVVRLATAESPAALISAQASVLAASCVTVRTPSPGPSISHRNANLDPIGEALAGILMVAGVPMWIAIPVVLFIGTVGAASVFKAVYVDNRELRCACAGGNDNAPRSFVS